jgi:hypothetical protein
MFIFIIMNLQFSKEDQLNAIYKTDFGILLSKLNVDSIPFSELKSGINISLTEFTNFVKTKDLLNDFSKANIGKGDGFYIEVDKIRYKINFQENGKIYRRTTFDKFNDLEIFISKELFQKANFY